MGVNPQAELTLSWPVLQEYEGGEIVEWVGPEESDPPASTTTIAAAAGETTSSTGVILGAAGVVLGLVAPGFALRKPEWRAG